MRRWPTLRGGLTDASVGCLRARQARRHGCCSRHGRQPRTPTRCRSSTSIGGCSSSPAASTTSSRAISCGSSARRRQIEHRLARRRARVGCTRACTASPARRTTWHQQLLAACLAQLGRRTPSRSARRAQLWSLPGRRGDRRDHLAASPTACSSTACRTHESFYLDRSRRDLHRTSIPGDTPGADHLRLRAPRGARRDVGRQRSNSRCRKRCAATSSISPRVWRAVGTARRNPDDRAVRSSKRCSTDFVAARPEAGHAHRRCGSSSSFATAGPSRAGARSIRVGFSPTRAGARLDFAWPDAQGLLRVRSRTSGTARATSTCATTRAAARARNGTGGTACPVTDDELDAGAPLATAAPHASASPAPADRPARDASLSRHVV